MSQTTDRVFATQEFKDFVEEWVLLVENGRQPDALAEALIDWMGANHMPQLKTASRALNVIMSARTWPQMLEAMKKHITAQQLAVFEKDAEGSGAFYDGLRAIVDNEIEAYHNQQAEYLAQRQSGAVQPDAPEEGAGEPVEPAARIDGASGKKPAVRSRTEEAKQA